MIKYLTFGISISVISWTVGMILNGLFKKNENYKYISNLNFIKSNTLNKIIGIKYFKWIVKNTFFKFFNQKIKFEKNNITLTEMRREMTFAEISHLIAFIFVTLVAIYKCISQNILFAFTIMLVNTFMNLYPSLLQQENKRRIDKLMLKQKKAV